LVGRCADAGRTGFASRRLPRGAGGADAGRYRSPAAVGLEALSVRRRGCVRGPAPQDKAGIAAALADTEFAIRAEEATNTLFARWRFLHILLGCLIFALLALHVGAAIYYGLRWL
jgi:hypothetical protein